VSVKIEQESDGDVLERLTVTGDRESLIALAMSFADAIQDGKAKARIGDMRLRIRCEGDV
jgi:hypothetical protein